MTAGSQQARAVITGVGVVSPVGIGNAAFWGSLIAGRSGVGFLRGFPCDDLPAKLAAEIPQFDPYQYVSHRKLLKVMSRDIQLGVAAANLAMRDARLSRGQVDPDRLGVEFGAGRIATAPHEFAEAVRRSVGPDDLSNSGRARLLPSRDCQGMMARQEARRRGACVRPQASRGSQGMMARQEPRPPGPSEEFDLSRWSEARLGDVCPLWLLGKLPNMPSCLVSIEHDARGPNNTITARDSSALLALAEAVWIIERGAADCMIVGACSSNLSPMDIVKLSLYEGLSRRDDDPARASRPFDFERDGAVVGEGAAAFIVEERRHAVRRGADIYADVLGVGAGCDGQGYSNAAGGTGLVRAIGTALRRAEIEPCELGHINAHGKSTQRDDLFEARAYHRALGIAAESVPVTALKSYVGQFDAGSGAVELAGTLLALRHGEMPITLNYETPDPRCRLNVIHAEPYRLRTRTALCVNRTAMGQSAAAILRVA